MNDLEICELPIGTRIQVATFSTGGISYFDTGHYIEATIVSAGGWIGFRENTPYPSHLLPSATACIGLSAEQRKEFPYVRCYNGTAFYVDDPNICPQCGEKHP